MKRIVWLLPLLAAAQDITVDKDVVYSQGSRLMMNIARPKADGPRPAVITIHGGGFQSGDRGEFDQLIKLLAEHGYVAASVDYRLAPRSQFPAALQDVKAAVRFLRTNAAKYAIDPDRIALVGASAGAHLALMAGLTPGVTDFEGGPNRDVSTRVQCVVSVAGPTDLARAFAKSKDAASALGPFLGGDPANTPAAYALASPTSWVTPQAPPTLLIHGSKDDVVPAEQASFLQERFKAVGATAELAIIDGMGHTPAGNEFQTVTRRIAAFLDDHLGMNPAKKVVLIADHGARGQIVALEWPTGRELWTVPNRNGHDVQPLPNGHILYTLGNDHKIVEMDADRKPVWTYGVDEGLQHPISAQRLPNGNTLIGDAQAGKVIEIDRDRKVVWKYESADLANMRMRNSRRTEAGTTLISVEAAGKIIEVNPAGEIIWSFTGEGGPKRKPYKAIRLPNGNTIISLNDPGEVVEVTPAGKVVRSIGGEKNDIRMIWSSGIDVFPDGNVLISDYQGHRLIEVDKAGKVVHEVRFPSRSTASIAIVP